MLLVKLILRGVSGEYSYRYKLNINMTGFVEFCKLHSAAQTRF